MDRRSFAYGLHCKESNLDHQRPIKECALSKIALAAAPKRGELRDATFARLEGHAASAQVMAGLISEGWPDSISGLILPCGNGADWNCHAQ